MSIAGRRIRPRITPWKGPAGSSPRREDLYRHLASLWKNSSIQLDNLCTANGIRYYHFLQPNLFLTGSKPLTESERHMATYRDDMYRPGVKEGYPLLIREGRHSRRAERNLLTSRGCSRRTRRAYMWTSAISIRPAMTCWPIGLPRRSSRIPAPPRAAVDLQCASCPSGESGRLARHERFYRIRLSSGVNHATISSCLSAPPRSRSFPGFLSHLESQGMD